MARRAGSISRAVIRARLVDFRPKSPNATELPRWARPVLRPLNCLRYLVRLGCSMLVSQLATGAGSAPAAAGAAAGAPASVTTSATGPRGAAAKGPPLQIQT